jgi:hypothetical protein
MEIAGESTLQKILEARPDGLLSIVPNDSEKTCH